MTTAALALGLTAGCAAAPGPTAVPATGPAVASTSATTSTSASSSTSITARTPTAMSTRCGRPDAEAVELTVPGPDGATLWTGAVGTGGTVALLLHQTGSAASCGWWPFANRLAEQGVRAVMLDFCGYGRSTCGAAGAWATDYVDQVARTVAALRAEGAARVTLVGASLGGTVATVAATTVGADAVVDLSGFGFDRLETGPALATLRVPVLAAGSRTEGPESSALESQVLASPAPSRRFLWAEAGHGWSLLLDGPMPDAPTTPVGAAVVAWVRGAYA